jgi:hypothetical protein
MIQLLPLAALVATAAPAPQLQLPKQSPHARVMQVVGTTEIAIDYHRPSVRGRTIWGELVPYGKVWRAGANDATTLTFGGPVTIGGQALDAGTYGFFALPERESWTLIVNAVGEQWGSYNYDVAKDLVRIEVRPEAAPMQEAMAFTIDPVGSDKARVRLAWEKLAVSFEIQVDVHGPMLAQIREAAAKSEAQDWRFYYSAARYCYDNGLEKEQALAWADRSVGIEQNRANLEVLALLLHANGKTADAIPPMERALELGRESKAPPEFIARVEAKLAAWKK